MPIIIPIILIALKSVSNYPTHPFGEGLVSKIINFIGNPVIALLVGVFLAFTLKKKVKEATHYDWVTSGLKEAGILLLEREVLSVLFYKPLELATLSGTPFLISTSAYFYPF